MKTATASLANEVSPCGAESMTGAAQALSRFARTLHDWKQRSRTRRALRELSNECLEDVGLDPVDAMREAAKPFWRA